MYQQLGSIKLKSGEEVEAGVVRGPDLEWAQRLVELLWHKGDPWNWQNAQLLERDSGLDAFFYVLHRDGKPFANIMTVERSGVGIFGHVWTQPTDRQQGASSSLMRLQMQDFVARGGQALFLNTGYKSVAYQMYASFGFVGIEAESGTMAYYTKTPAAFEAAYFAQGPLEIQALAWPHWSASVPLFVGDYPGSVRSAGLQLFGRHSTESALLPVLVEAAEHQQANEPPTVLTLCNQATTAVVGLAAWSWHPLWPDTCLVDCYCHPTYWQHAPSLLDALQLPPADRSLVYVDADHAAKLNLFAKAGFKAVTTLPKWIACDTAKKKWADVVVMQR